MEKLLLLCKPTMFAMIMRLREKTDTRQQVKVNKDGFNVQEVTLMTDWVLVNFCMFMSEAMSQISYLLGTDVCYGFKVP